MKELERVARLVSGLSELEFKVLENVEKLADQGRVSTPDLISKSLRLSVDYVAKVLEKLNGHGLVWSPAGRGREYMLNYKGLDLLALHSASRRGILTHIGTKIGVGKEADVHLGLTGEGAPIAVRFYRIGRQSMVRHKRLRETSLEAANYLASSKAAAKREIEALRILYQRGVPVPAPIYRNRHMVVTSLIEGDELARLRKHPEPEVLLREILGSVRAAMNAGVIHCDLSPYNILLAEDGRHVIIDWPQWVKPTHPNADAYLRRDVANLVSFFKRKLGVRVDMDELLEFVLKDGGLGLASQV
ncbi:MAG: RIO1 family regulatory kinase/ATPase [Nitrososphaerota archaeon]